MSPIRLAKWKLAVLTELAENGAIAVVAVFSGDAPLDFRVTSVSAAAAGYLRKFADAIVGASLENALYAGDEWGEIHLACVEVATTGIDALCTAKRCSELRGATVLLHISRSATGLALDFSCPEAQRRKLNAQDSLQAPLEMQSAQDSAQRSERAFRPPVWTQAIPAARVRGRTQEESVDFHPEVIQNKELRRANEPLKVASAFFAQAELDRRFKS